MAKPDPALLDPARYRRTTAIATRYADLDTNRHINNIAMAALFEDARVRFQIDLAADGIMRPFMVASFAIEYLNQAHYPAPITFHSAVIGHGRTSITVLQLAMQEGTPVALGTSVMVLTDGTRPAPLPEEWPPRLALLALLP